MREPKLDATEISSGAGKKVRDYANERMAELRRKNDNTALTPDKTAVIRGEISGLKRILKELYGEKFDEPSSSQGSKDD
jgi:hypothetical protein